MCAERVGAAELVEGDLDDLVAGESAPFGLGGEPEVKVVVDPGLELSLLVFHCTIIALRHDHFADLAEYLIWYRLVPTGTVCVMQPEWTEGDRLRKAREVAGVGVQEMADQLEVTRNTIRRWERGVGGVPRRSVLAYAQVTGVPVEWLETGRELVTEGYPVAA